MSPEDIAALAAALAPSIQEQVNTAVTTSTAAILAEVDKKNKGTAAALKREVGKALKSIPAPAVEEELEDDEEEPIVPAAAPAKPAKDSKETLGLKSLRSEIRALREENTAKDKLAKESKRNEAIREKLSDAKVSTVKGASKLFLADHGSSIEEENGQYFVTINDETISLDLAIKSFLESEEGCVFLPASGKKGSGSKNANPQPARQTPTDDQWVDSLFE